MSSSIPSSIPQPPPPIPETPPQIYSDRVSIDGHSEPTLYNLFFLAYRFFGVQIRYQTSRSPSQTVQDIRKSAADIIENNPAIWLQLVAVLLCALLLTKLRQSLTNFVIPNYLVRYDLIKSKDVNKVAESMFSSLFYGSTFLLTVYIVHQNQYITKPELIWSGFSASAPVPTLIGFLYLLEISFYLHNMYAVFKINEWKKDSMVLFVHHIVACTLLNLSYLTRVYPIGILVLVFHDICDVIMDTTKVLIKLNFQHWLLIKLLDAIRVTGFVLFTTSWFVLRLYYFPIWGLFQSTIYLAATPDHWFPYMTLLYSFLWLIYLMNLYWASWIVFTTINVIRGGKKQMDDIRDFDYPNDQQQQQQRQQRSKSKSNKKLH